MAQSYSSLAIGNDMSDTAKIPAGTRVLSVLYADDNVQLGEIVVLLLRQRGHRAEHVKDGREGMARVVIDLGQFDVVVTDHSMPGVSGLEYVTLLSQAGYSGRIVVYSSSVTDETAHRYRTLGVDAIITKSSTPGELLAAIEQTGSLHHHAYAADRR